MTLSTSRLASLLFLSLAACGSVTDDETTSTSDTPSAEDPSTPSDSPNDPASGVEFRFFTADAGGVPTNAFASLDEAHLTSAGTLNVAPGDYYFYMTYQVCPRDLPQDQYFPEQAPVACRSFTVGANGHIVSGAPVTEVDGVACPHVATATASGLAISLTPFELHGEACGIFLASVIPAGLGQSPVNAVANLFFTAPVDGGEAPPVCGDGQVDAGEECDDGNENDHDGCSASCHVETEDC